MSESPVYAAQAAIRDRLIAANGPWGNRVRWSEGLSGWPFPYVVLVFGGGAEQNRWRAPDVEIVIVVKAVSDTAESASEASALIADALNDRGRYDNSDALSGGASWDIKTVSREDFVSYTEPITETKMLFHEGARFRLVMEAI
jgi:hypothetical protein